MGDPAPVRVEVDEEPRWADAVAERFCARLRQRPRLRVCLPTGRTPRGPYAAIAERVAGGQASLAEAEVLLLDEFGGLAPDDPARCATMLARDLLDRLDAAPAAVHHLDPDADDVAAECARYRRVVADGGLDLCLLGIGANGHVGLNEPGSAPDAPTRRVALAPETIAAARDYGGNDAPRWGLTLGMAEILEAREVWLLVAGGHKAEVLAEALEGPVTPELPASLLRGHTRLLVLADEPAAEKLSASLRSPAGNDEIIHGGPRHGG